MADDSIIDLSWSDDEVTIDVVASGVSDSESSLVKQIHPFPYVTDAEEVRLLLNSFYTGAAKTSANVGDIPAPYDDITASESSCLPSSSSSSARGRDSETVTTTSFYSHDHDLGEEFPELVPLFQAYDREFFQSALQAVEETLLHEMIHAYLFVTQANQDRDSHGPSFLRHMNRINDITGLDHERNCGGSYVKTSGPPPAPKKAKLERQKPQKTDKTKLSVKLKPRVADKNV